tara:strand:- start:956 stop:1333 length:378 start_codon:yes stop_codon:yes gene_type:complete
MYAIVDIKGKQFRVEKDQKIEIPKITDKVGSTIEFDKVLLTNDNGKVSTKSSLKVIAKVLSHEIADKVVVFKMKRRKGYQKKNGHKQQYTMIQIKDLKSGKKTTASTKKTTAKKTVQEKTTKSKD